ncbi:MAG: LacI family DNA-binding transcriptional regulator [Planctomycetota bacterium]
MKRVTRQDVASAAGVSLTTVTHALNAPEGARVNPETRNRIKKIAQELGYRPNFVGKALVSGKTYNIGMLQPSLETMFMNYTLGVVYGLMEGMKDSEYMLLMMSAKREDQCRRAISQGRVDGLIAVSITRDDVDVLADFSENNTPIIIVNHILDTEKYSGVCSVNNDFDLLKSEIVAHLKEKGKSSLACFSNVERSDTAYQINKIFKDEPDFETYPVHVDTFEDEVRELFQQGKRWDGVVIKTFRHAEQYIEVAAEYDMMPGRDFELVIVDFLNYYPKMTAPGITIFYQDVHQLGIEAWKLMAAIVEKNEKPESVKVPYIKSEYIK